jgi:hypothetical protein
MEESSLKDPLMTKIRSLKTIELKPALPCQGASLVSSVQLVPSALRQTSLKNSETETLVGKHPGSNSQAGLSISTYQGKSQ